MTSVTSVPRLTPVTARIRYFLAAVALLVSTGATQALSTAPASATVTRLCYGYSACSRAGMSSAGYDRNNATMYWRMYAGHNCTNYAAYRMVLSGLPNVRPWSGSGNAMYWGTSMSSITDQTPRVGAVAWWKANVSPAGSVGHVAYVEQVISPDEIIVSQDSWGGDFSWARITKTSSGWPSGFVHFHDAALESTGRPTVTGTPRVGGVLTATPGTWSQSGVTTTYQWRAGRHAIPGATGPTLTLTGAQLGRRVKVVVTASTASYPATSASSLRTSEVAPGVLASTATPVVTGTAVVDGTVRVGSGSWSAVPDSVTYQWRADGTPVAGADDASLTPDAALEGKALSVTVTAHRAGYDDGVATTAPTEPVSPGTLVADSRPSITGTPRVGKLLTLTTGHVSPDATLGVHWLRNGERIRGAFGLTYQLTDADAGARVGARAHWSRPGYERLRMRTPQTARVTAAR
jgi:surface antigen